MITDASGLCRDCGARLIAPAGRCPACGSRRCVIHRELHALPIAHIDCDAFYASVEKRDDPALADRPVIVGGGHRGVVSACCYVARLYGVRSAMPMFKALALCPDAVVIPPDMRKYQTVGHAIRQMMREATPLVEPLSIDEAFLDLSGTDRLHGGSPAQTVARLIARIEREVGVTASVGLAPNKFLAKVASDLDKPRGFSVIGRAEAQAFLAPKPVGLLWGVGKALQAKLEADGLRTIGDLAAMDEFVLVRRYGSIGRRLARFSKGQDDRTVEPDSPAKSVSAETTFSTDIADAAALERRLWPLCETVARRLKSADLAGGTVVLKLKTSDFRQFTRSHKLDGPTQLADRMFREGMAMVTPLADGTRYRLIGIGVSDLCNATGADAPDLLDPGRQRRASVERAIDAVRSKLGDKAILKGRALAPDDKERR
ncbi:DNA polymerase IV [Azospirillum sp. RWY-5-1]|uniref:DNA polymerase IV n=1 Tax=Azospirillum oleiclasticum TaxID=2735135 RepID=A0ABX2T5I5_9PROT|nr:DNA polymerase IV [Azospirillum oleiclasticum]NYZ11401.1 DNA polymerase IV [Azospirillum oleiclasticum]NYZ18562.1 DNA polymerase IV [Azospirillum oleiclasticum]